MLQLVVVVELQGAWAYLKMVEVMKMVAAEELQEVWEEVEKQRRAAEEVLRMEKVRLKVVAEVRLQMVFVMHSAAEV